MEFDDMGRDTNIEIFKDTENLVKKNPILKEAVTASTRMQKVILETENVGVQSLNRYAKDASVIVSKKRTFDAAAAYRGKKVAVLNFASASNPGGGVTKGSSAQEECLCRCSGLYFNLNVPYAWNGFYTPHRKAKNPTHNDDIIYTPSVTIFKTDTANPALLPEKDWYQVNIISCAAPSLREKPSNGFNSGDGNECIKISDRELLQVHEKRLRRILDVAAACENEVVILGAFGCGAFKNKPEVVALAAKNVLKDYWKAFETIEFAVYSTPRDEGNYKTFARVLHSLKK